MGVASSMAKAPASAPLGFYGPSLHHHQLSYGGNGAQGSPYAYGPHAPGFAAPPGHHGYGNYGYTGYPGRTAIPSFPFTGFPGPHSAKEPGVYSDQASGRFRLGMAEPTGSYPGDDFPAPGGPGYGHPGVSDYYYGRVGFGPVETNARPFRGEDAERAFAGNPYANRQ